MTHRTSSHRRHARLSTLLLLFALPAVAAAVEPVNRTRPDGVAIHGYDPVAYFEDGHAVEGSQEWTAEWNGATWRFASAEHRDVFVADPEAYAPQYGGYCAFAVSKGSTADIDPEAWTIRDGKLYLNYSPSVRERWLADVDAAIAAADRHWPSLVDEE